MTTSKEISEGLEKVAENQPKVYQAGVDAVKKELNTGIVDEGKDNVVTGHPDTVGLSEGNAAEARLFQELIKAGIIPEGSTEYTGGRVRGNNSIHSGSGFTDGDFNINHGRGNYTNGKNAKAIGYEQFVDGQDSTAIGTMNIIRAFAAGFVYGSGNTMTPDGNKDTPTDTETRTGFIVGSDSEIHADSSWIGGLLNKIFHENVYILGRKITSQYKDQLLFGFNPAVTDRTLFAVGDGTDAAPHNLIVAYKDMNTRRATHMWFNTRVMTEGNVESDKKVIAKQAPTQDNDCIRWQEYQALLKRVQDLEAKLK